MEVSVDTSENIGADSAEEQNSMITSDATTDLGKYTIK